MKTIQPQLGGHTRQKVGGYPVCVYTQNARALINALA